MLVTVFSDASFCHRLRCAGWGAYIVSNRGRLEIGGAMRHTIMTSTAAEAAAAANALWQAVNDGLAWPGDTVVLQMDCLSGVDALAGRGKTPGGCATPLDAVRRMAVRNRLTVDARHVRGHNGHSGEARSYANEVCDQLTRAGLNVARSRVQAMTGSVWSHADYPKRTLRLLARRRDGSWQAALQTANDGRPVRDGQLRISDDALAAEYRPAPQDGGNRHGL